MTEIGVSSITQVTGYAEVEPGNYNYIKTTTAQIAGITDTAQFAGKSSDEIMVAVSYFDALGRPNQNVLIEASPTKKHIVSPIIYDEYGRQSVSYLPYIVEFNSGVYQTNPVGTSVSGYITSPQYLFYQNQANVAHDVAPYSSVTYENSPLSRVIKQTAAGAAWQDVEQVGNDKSILLNYEANSVNEVVYFELTGTLPNSNGYWPQEQLYKNSTTDEEGNNSIQFLEPRRESGFKKSKYGDDRKQLR